MMGESSMTTAQVPVGWPADRPLAVSVSVMLEGWEAPDAPGMGPMGNVLRPGTVDLQARSWADYGAKVGAWRLLDLLDQEETKAVFYTSGIVAQQYPALPAAIVARGHSVGAHGWSQGTLPAYLTAEQEMADIARCVAVITATAGSAPAGWLSPRCTPSERTSALLAAQGFRFHAEMFDSDLPYRLETEAGSLVGVPFHDGGERHAALRAVWERTGRLHADPNEDCGGLAPAGQSIRLPGHYAPCACFWTALRCSRVPGLAGGGETQPALLADGPFSAGGVVGLTGDPKDALGVVELGFQVSHRGRHSSVFRSAQPVTSLRKRVA
jgi:peptidoglycan/xylan/chitin deacetylase (PgdA/CDA1 family)